MFPSAAGRGPGKGCPTGARRGVVGAQHKAASSQALVSYASFFYALVDHNLLLSAITAPNVTMCYGLCPETHFHHRPARRGKEHPCAASAGPDSDHGAGGAG